MDVAVIVAAVAGVVAGPAVSFVTRPWDAVPAPLASLLCATGCAAMAWRFAGAPANVVAYCVLVVALVSLTWIDLRVGRLPREISYPAAVVGAVALVVAARAEESTDRVATAALGAVVATATLGLLFVVSRGGLGDGDVRLAPLLGMYLGYLDLILVPIALLVGALLGSVAAVVAMARGADRRSTIPFGPFLAAGTLTAILV